MPIEIKELIIKANISDPRDAAANSSDAGSSNNGGGLNPMEKAALIQECVDQVMSILERQKSR